MDGEEEVVVEEGAEEVGDCQHLQPARIAGAGLQSIAE